MNELAELMKRVDFYFGHRFLLKVLIVWVISHSLLLVYADTDSNFFATDENAYVQITRFFSNEPVITDVPSLSMSLANASLALHFPAKFLVAFGLQPIFALRAISAFYSFLCLILFVLMLSFQSPIMKSKSSRDCSLVRKSVLVIYVLFPSHALWHSLALRESAAEFFSMLFICSLFGLTKNRITLPLLITLYVAFVLALIGITFSRWQYIFSLLGCLLFGLFYLFPTKRRLPLTLLTLTTLLSISFSNSYFSPNEIYMRLKGTSAVVSESISSRNDPANSKIEIFNVTNPAIIEESALASNLSSFSTGFVNFIWHLISVIMRPFVFFDTDSAITWLAALENLCFIGLFFFVYLQISRYISLINKEILLLSSWTTIHFVVLAMYEQNIGTAFRHKSITLWSLLFLTVFIHNRKKNFNPL
jgi:hypothetical protein